MEFCFVQLLVTKSYSLHRVNSFESLVSENNSTRSRVCGHKGLICNLSFKTDRPSCRFVKIELGRCVQKAPPPATQNASQKSSGHKNIEVGGTKFKFGHLILRKIIKTVVTRCHILSLKCTKFDFGWGSAPDPARGAQNAPPDLLAGF